MKDCKPLRLKCFAQDCMLVNLKKHIRRHSVVFVFWRSIFDLFFITTKVQTIYLLLCLSNNYIRYPIFTFHYLTGGFSKKSNSSARPRITTSEV